MTERADQINRMTMTRALSSRLVASAIGEQYHLLMASNCPSNGTRLPDDSTKTFKRPRKHAHHVHLIPVVTQDFSGSVSCLAKRDLENDPCDGAFEGRGFMV